MEIKGLEGFSGNEIKSELERGAKFVIFTYCFSIIVVTFRRSSDIYFVRSRESAIKYGWPWLLISFVFGWWGIPWGPIYTIQAIFRSFSGKDVTLEVLESLRSQEDVDEEG
jgi:hypothetical protein